jgi:nitrogen fixation-related uncharacterized protein
MILAVEEIAYEVYAVMLFVSLVVFGGGAVWALNWAFRNGQMSNFARGATSIFDPDEPEGEVTDSILSVGKKEPRKTPGDADV